MMSISERYVKLILKTGLFDSDFVDAYYGPEQWKQEIESQKSNCTLDTINEEAETLLGEIHAGSQPHDRYNRTQYLIKQVSACLFRIRMLMGETFTFDEESFNLYDAVAPSHDADYYQQLLKELDRALPGQGTVSSRLNVFKKNFIIPPKELDKVFQAAIAECRIRSMKKITLPDKEQFVIDYVTGKPWSGYNWFKGNFFSLIQINTDLPIYIDRAIDLACHEGYPGHHVYNALIESELVRKRGWTEFTVYPLFCPQSLIAEGTANYGIELTFPGDERVAFERDILFPICGFDPDAAKLYYHIHELTQRLSYAGNDAARGYLDKTMSREAAVQWLIDYGLFSPERAAQRIKFFDAYRSYVINYNLGLDLVRAYIDKKTQGSGDPNFQWSLFYEMLTEPLTPSQLTQL